MVIQNKFDYANTGSINKPTKISVPQGGTFLAKGYNFNTLGRSQRGDAICKISRL